MAKLFVVGITINRLFKESFSETILRDVVFLSVIHDIVDYVVRDFGR